MENEQIILEAFESKKMANVKMPNWTRAEKRPSENHLVAWEIYSNPKTALSEKDTVLTLNALVTQNKLVIDICGDTIWYKKL